MILFLRMFCGCFSQLGPYAFLCFYPFDGRYRLPKKKTILLTMLLLTGLSLFFAVASMILAAFLPTNGTFLWNMVNLVFFLCLVPCFVWYLYAVKAIWQQKLFVFSFMLTCALTITYICDYVMNSYTWYLGDHHGASLPYSGATIPGLLLTNAIVLPLLRLLIKKFYLPVRDGLDRKDSGYLAFLSLALFILLGSGLSFISVMYLVMNPLTVFLFVALLVTVFVIYIVIFRMYYFAHERTLLQQENIQVQHQLELHDEQYHRITETIQASRKLRHDIKHHIFVVQGLLAEGEIEKAEKYLSEYLDTVNQYAVMNLCGNFIINMIVSHYYAQAKENEIDFKVRINVPKELPIHDSDISVLLGNLLENAIRAAFSAPEDKREIQLNMIVSGQALVITVDNSFDGKLAYENGEYLSTKPNHRGYGLKSIVNIAKKYNGEAEFTCEDTVFHSSVVLEFVRDDSVILQFPESLN